MPTRSLIRLCLLAAAALPVAAPAWADKADRGQPIMVAAEREGVLDLQRQLLVGTGNVVVSQGSMVLRAERVEMRTLPDGHRSASATGAAGKPATWRQKREGLDETVEGAADRIEFDGRADTLRFLGNGVVRRLRGGTVADEITGERILWDNTAEVFRVEGGTASPTNPGGRVRAVLSPRAEAPASAPAVPVPPLQPSRRLGDAPPTAPR
ncbi:MAG: lipopolysaccharide transport periplasmic protein LptA [Rubrivivax sp.]